MTPTQQPRYSKDEFTRRGNALYEEQVRAQVEQQPGSRGKVVALDIETGQFEMAGDAIAASDKLLAHVPDAQIWFVRVGSRALHRFGPRPAAAPPKRETEAA